VRTALEKLPADRFSSAAEFAAALGGPSGQGATRSESEPVLAPQPGRSDVRGQRGMWWLAAGLVVAAAVAGSAWLFARRADEHATVAAGEHTTLAVLPFLTLTPQADLDFLRVGIADAIITQLANARQLRVRPTSAILAFDGRREDPRRAGQLLVAEYVVTGRRGTTSDLSFQVLNGDYAPKSSSYVGMPPIDIGQWSDVHLQYRRWLTVEDSHFDQARILVASCVHQLRTPPAIRVRALRALSTAHQRLVGATTGLVLEAVVPFTDRLREAQAVTGKLRDALARAERRRADLERRFATIVDPSLPWGAGGALER